MPNYKYLKGARKERQLVNEYRAKGWTAFRSAGSHSPIDVVLINKTAKQLFLVQCKTKISAAEKDRLIAEQKDLNGMYDVIFTIQ